MGSLVNELVIEKRHNPILDLSIAYGLLYILTHNFIEATLHNYKSAYVIRHEDIDFEEGLDLIAPELEDIQFDKLLKNNNKKTMFTKIFDDFGNNKPSVLLDKGVFEGIIEYYSTDVNTRDKKVIPNPASKKDEMGAIGSWYGVRGQRINGHSIKNLRIDLFERWLSEIGFVFACSFLFVNNTDYLLWMAVPSDKGIKKVRKFNDVKVNTETNEREDVTYSTSKSVMIALAEHQLKVQQKITSSNIKEEYDGVVFMRGWPNGQSASVDKLHYSDWYPFADITLDETINYLRNGYQTNLDIQNSTSRWIKDKRKEDFYDFLFTLIKNKKTIELQEGMDYLKMYKLEELHRNQGVSILGQRLNLLLFKKRGYEVLNELMDVHTKSDLMQAVYKLSVAFNKLPDNKSPLWNLKDYSKFIEVFENQDYTAKDIVSAIIIHSQTFRRTEDKE